VVAVEVGGNKVTEVDVKKYTVVNAADGTWSLRSDGKEVTRGTSTIDPAKTPRTLDFTATEGELKGNRYLGIYELGEKARKMCFAPPGKERPTEFASPPGGDHILVTFEREKAR
ncbi:MAG TPA: TIGR03067 domain-containing protein, partial [Gemmataceae bacterium]|nr:TIGR03067 domain-containing protein [Gemmataceae bacterium]